MLAVLGHLDRGIPAFSYDQAPRRDTASRSAPERRRPTFRPFRPLCTLIGWRLLHLLANRSAPMAFDLPSSLAVLPDLPQTGSLHPSPSRRGER